MLPNDPFGIDETLDNNLEKKVIAHKKRFKRIFKARYLEMIPSLIKYKNGHTVAVDFLKVEIALRNGYDVVIGETTKRNIQVIGFITTKQTETNPAVLWSGGKITKKDISFIIPKHLQYDHYHEITDYDSCQTGNFTILRNKSVNYVDDQEIINHYIDEIAEIELSRYSIAMQVKINTLFMGDVNDETLNTLIVNLYNGVPYSKVSKLFDPIEQIYHMQNTGIAQNFAELKRERQNKVSELNSMLGINSLAVEKESGVSDGEANANRAYTTGNANIYLDPRNHGLRKLNKRYGLKLQALYNDEVASEFQELHNEQEKENEGGESVK